ncbi:MAG: HTH-type transcriptional activator Btr [Lentisphaerae bacterium ADurb.Bin242]|nr:MAG: HTH-type transcriptional activator Btr [Lentisphaerae bacterium ADurb.Bin242]
MKIISDPAVLSEDFWGKRERPSGTGYTSRSVSHVKYYAYLTASSLYRKNLLYCDVVSRYRLLPRHRFWLIRPDFLSLRLCLDGSELVHYDGKKYRMEPGDLMIFRPFHDYEYATGEEGFCEKLSLTMKGTALPEILQNSGLSKIFYLKLNDVSFFASAHAQLEALLRTEGLPDLERCAGLCMELLQALSRRAPEMNCPQKLLEIRQYIEQHTLKEASLEKLSAEFGLSASGISHLFRKHLNCSVREYAIRSRMERARVLMLEQGFSCKEAASEIGYSNQFNFSSEFKKYYGKSPRDFMREVEPE